MGTRHTFEGTVSLCQCTQRCTQSSMSLACLLRSRSRFKARRDENYCLKHGIQEQNPQQQKGLSHGAQATRKRNKGRNEGRGPSKKIIAPSPEIDRVDRGVEAALADPCCSFEDRKFGMVNNKSWDSRRRDSKLNGADIYVARITKHGMGSAKPCWRCLYWCYWAGIRRIFHWDDIANKWAVVRVNNPGKAQYQTTSDSRLYAGGGLLCC